MNKQTPKQFVARKPSKRYRIHSIDVRPQLGVPLSPGEAKILDGFKAYYAEHKQYPLTKQLAEFVGIANRTHVSEQLHKLVVYGEIGAFQKNNKQMWCDRDHAKTMAIKTGQKINFD